MALRRFRRAVVTFVEVDAVDESDADSVAEAAVRQALRNRFTGGTPDYAQMPMRLPRGGVRIVDVFGVQELGRAARNGALWVTTTGQPFRRYSEEEPQ